MVCDDLFPRSYSLCQTERQSTREAGTPLGDLRSHMLRISQAGKLYAMQSPMAVAPPGRSLPSSAEADIGVSSSPFRVVSFSPDTVQSQASDASEEHERRRATSLLIFETESSNSADAKYLRVSRPNAEQERELRVEVLML